MSLGFRIFLSHVSFKHLFNDLKNFDGGKFLLDDDHECKVKGMGSVTLSLSDETTRSSNDVRFVPKL